MKQKSLLYLILSVMVVFALASCKPGVHPVDEPSVEPSEEPSASPSEEPSKDAPEEPSEEPSEDVSEEPAAAIIDGDFSEWDDVEEASADNMGSFKALSDAKNLYFYVYRTSAGRFSAIWGGEGYIYIGFELDGDPENNTAKLWAANAYDLLLLIKPYGGSEEDPIIIEKPGSDCEPAPSTAANIVCAGDVDEDGAAIEFSVPRADISEIPTTPITVYAWGNKDLASEGNVALECTL